MNEIITRIPFDTDENEIIIMQGFNSPMNHNGKHRIYDLSYAVDFVLPFNTKILAVKDGVVHFTDYQNNQYYEGMDPVAGRNIGTAPTIRFSYPEMQRADKARVVCVLQHIDPDKSIESGTKVKAGDIIGETGRTGWVGPVPHLHMHFEYRLPRTSRCVTIPFSFKGYRESLDDADVVKRLQQSNSDICRKMLELREKF